MRTAVRRNHRVRLLTQGLRPTFRDGLSLPINMTEDRYTGRTSGRPFNPYVPLNTGGTTYEVNSWADFNSAINAQASSATNNIIKINVPFEIPAGSLPKVLPQRINANLRCDIVGAAVYNGTFQRGPTERVDGTETFATITRGLTSDTSSQPFFTTGSPGTNLASGYRWIGIKWMYHPTQKNIPGLWCFFFGAADATQNTAAKVPKWHIVDRCWFPGSTTCETRGCFFFGANEWAVINSRIDHVWCRTSTWNDPMCIGAYNGQGPGIIENNYLDASGENWYFGGGKQDCGVNNSDLLVRRNYCTKDYAFYHGVDGGGAVTIKNLGETKQAVRTVVEDNWFANSWREHPSSQDGTAMVWKINTYGFLAAESRDLLFRGNRVTNAAILTTLLGTDVNGTGYLQEIHYLDNVFENWNTPPYNYSPRGISFAGSTRYGQISVEHNTMVTESSLAGCNLLSFDNSIPTDGIEKLHFNNNVAMLGQYGFNSSFGEGTAALNKHVASWTCSGNQLIRASVNPATYPDNNSFPSALSGVYETTDITAKTWRVKSSVPRASDGYTVGVSDWDHFSNRLAGVTG